MRSSVNFSIAALAGGILFVASNSAAAQSAHWQTLAQWHRLAKKAVPGTLLLDDDGLEF